jgi:hypothetical protein
MNLMRNLIGLIAVLIFLAACQRGGEDAGDANAVPTQAVLAELAEPEAPATAPAGTAAAENPEPPATSRADASATQSRATPENPSTPTASAAPELALADAPYTHESGAFSLVPPAGWTIEESSGSASFDAPEGTGFIYVQVTNTGYQLDGEAFSNFVTNRDLNFFDDFDGYEVVSEEIDTTNGAAIIVKFLNYNDVDQTVITFYYQYGQIIYNFDFWSDHDFFDAYDVLYRQVVDTADVNPDAALDQAEYLWVYTFTGPDELFTIEVPTAWRYERSESDATIVDAFTAPDGHAVIQNITYDNQDFLSRGEAGALGRRLLQEFYAADLRIIDDQVQADGSERLIWESASGGYRGISFLEARDTIFLLLTTMYDNALEEVYIDTLEYTISTYTIPG